MKMQNHTKEELLIIKPEEKRLDAKIAMEFKENLVKLIKEGQKNILINLEEVEFIDSSGLGAIVAGLKNAKPDGELMLCGLQPAVKSLIELTRLNKIFQIYLNEKDALEKTVK